MGFVFGPVTALALSQVRHSAGTALALMGAVQFVLAGIAAFVVGLGGAMDLKPLVLTLGVLAIIALCGVFVTPKAAK
jgi:DHA1 family bicyclomycin/chloramphenicol resistance-like MFS transporter